MKKPNLILAVLIITLVYNCTAPHELYVEGGNNKLARQINGAIKKSGLVTNMGIKVIALESGKTLYSLNSNHLFTPASNNKLYTASAALHYLSPQFKFETSVWIDSTYKDSAHVPRLVLVGGGDPDIYLPELESIAREISKNIRSIDTLIIDNTLFDNAHYGPGWMWDEESTWHFAQVNAMAFNDNCVDITIEPAVSGDKPKISVNPNTNYVTIINEAITVEDTVDLKQLEIERRWWENNNIIDISGELLHDTDEKVYSRTVHDPLLYTGNVLIDLLSKSDTKVKYGVLEGQKNSTMVLINKYYSEPFTNSLSNFLKTSDNLSGELYVKMMGHLTSGEQGNWDNGLLAVKTFLNDAVKIDTTKMRIADGSGVSRYNLTSPDQLIQLLTYMYSNHAYNAEFLSALACGGWDGTLKNRMNGVKNDRSLRAKTGHVSGVSCLSGYAFTKSGDPLAFSIMMNGYIGSSKPFRKLQDRIAGILVKF